MLRGALEWELPRETHRDVVHGLPPKTDTCREEVAPPRLGRSEASDVEEVLAKRKTPAIAKPVDTVELDEVKMLSKDDGAVIDAKALSKATVVCTVISQGRAKKIRVFKFKRRKNYHRTYGHRQPYTELKVDKIKG